MTLYLDLASEERIEDIPQDTVLKDRLGTLATFIEEGNVDEESLEQIIPLHLDAVGIVAATGGDPQPLEPGYISIFGPVRERKGILLESSDDRSHNWFFATQVQGHYRTKTGQPIKDLELDDRRSDGSDVCDFKVERDNGTDLLECTRFNASEASLASLSDKIWDRTTKKAHPQLRDTENDFDIDDAYRHFLIDITRCRRTSWNHQHSDRDIRITGYTQEDIEKLSSLVQQEPNIDQVDRITLAWTETIHIDGIPRVTVQRTHPINLTQRGEAIRPYDGWTIGGYKRQGSEEPLTDLQVHSEAKTMAWIIASVDGFDQNFFSAGPAKPTGE